MDTEKTSVLIVDDSQTMREVLKAIVRNEGFVVAGEATDGQSALAAVLRTRPDLVCLDVNMPGQTGLEVLQAIRKQSPATRVVMVTSDASFNTVRNALSFGADGYIIKPFNQAKIGDTLRSVLSGSNLG